MKLTRKCKICGIKANRSYFEDGYGICKICYYILRKAQQEIRLRERTEEWHFIDKYGVHPVYKNIWYIHQKQKCAICGKKKKLKELFLDHDHSINKPRGLLCYKCNTLLGFCKDNTESLKKAILYLKENNNDQTVL